jgi:uncharacterized membrane protein YraQ (UPF0718 family)
MDWKTEWKPLVIIIILFLICFFMPLGTERFDRALFESFHLVRWYAREHVILCLIPAFFIAGAIAVFVSKNAVMKYLGPGANKVLAYGVASVSGSILAVCSCTVLPLFGSIYKMGAGLGPAAAFLYSGPAINVMAIIVTARVLGLEIGIARALGAVFFSIVIGIAMHMFFRSDEKDNKGVSLAMMPEGYERPLRQTVFYFLVMIAILVFANLGKPDSSEGIWYNLYALKWLLTSGASLLFAFILIRWYNLSRWGMLLTVCVVTLLSIIVPHEPLIPFAAGVIGLSILTSLHKGEAGQWFSSSWDFAKQILPLLLMGVFIAGLLLGRPGNEGLIPSTWISSSVGGNSLVANLFASVAGAFMYFATLTEVPILQGLMGSGMGKGPALALLLAGPALSLPNMLVIRSFLGTKKTVVFVLLVVVMATIAGKLYGALF